MRILVIGSGGREHALAWKLSQSPAVEKIFVAPGNGGTYAHNVNIDVSDLNGLRDFCKKENIDLVVPGPELPLTLGIADVMAEAAIPCFGPDKFCAQMEGSKNFAKQVMAKAGVPTARSAAFQDAAKAREYVKSAPGPVVVKADGLAAGKGVIVAENSLEALEAIDQMLEKRVFGDAGATVVIEEKLEGEEVSLLCFCDGKTALPLSSAQDHKAAFDDDKGPNTGGMGAYSPAPILPDDKLDQMADLVIRPVLKELAAMGHPFKGVLYAGLMMTGDGPKVLEYNARFGDPECQPLLMRLKSDLAEIMTACVEGRLDREKVEFDRKPALGVVLAAAGYPGPYEKGMPVNGLDNLPGDVVVFHSGTKKTDAGIVSNGGRVLCVTARGDNLQDAQSHAYAALKEISMPGSRCRHDIGHKGIVRNSQKAE